MKSRFHIALALAAIAWSGSAYAQDAAPTEPPKALTVTGSAALLTDYRLRGVSQSDEDIAVQGGLTVTHESGLYGSVWGSNLAGWGTFGGSNTELDLIGGFKAPVGGGAIDVGLTWYMYPGGADKTDFAEGFAKLTGTVGPVGLTAGVAYAPKQEALGRWYFTGAAAAAGVYDDPGDKKDNIYLWGDGAAAVPGTPLTAKAHIGWSKGNRGLGPNATSVAPTGEYWDWLLGVDLAVPGTPLTLSAAYVDTDISNREASYLRPSFSRGQDGTGNIAGPGVVLSVSAAF